MKFVDTFHHVSYNDIAANNYSLSASQYRGFYIQNDNRKKVREFLMRPLSNDDLGEEVGSLNYIERSPKSFLKTKALQPHSYIPVLTSESIECVRPSCFVDKNLKKNDIIISKDSNIGESAILDADYPDTMLSGALYRLPECKNKYYLFAFLKHALFKEQLDYMTPKGSVIRHCKTLFLDCEIPMPNTEAAETIAYVENLVRSVVTKESLIAERHREILRLIDIELNNQIDRVFHYQLPSYSDVVDWGRLDAAPYSEECRRMLFRIRNYVGGSKTIYEMGFSLSRGQNLQVSNIGDSIYSETYYPGFYTLMLPKFISKHGTCEKIEYLGNPHKLKTLKPGDLIFGAEGFEKGRSFVVVEALSKTITNIHGITITQADDGDIVDAIYVKCFLDYLRKEGLIDMLAVGGNGGSLAQKYWGIIPFPNFPHELKVKIAKLYHNPDAIYDSDSLNDSNFLQYDQKFDIGAGIYNLDKVAKHLRKRIDEAIENIANDNVVVRRY